MRPKGSMLQHQGRIGPIRHHSPLEDMLAQLEKGTPIEGKLSQGHYGLPYANFTREDIERALSACSSTRREGEDSAKGHHRGRELAS